MIARHGDEAEFHQEVRDNRVKYRELGVARLIQLYKNFLIAQLLRTMSTVRVMRVPTVIPVSAILCSAQVTLSCHFNRAINYLGGVNSSPISSL